MVLKYYTPDQRNIDAFGNKIVIDYYKIWILHNSNELHRTYWHQEPESRIGLLRLRRKLLKTLIVWHIICLHYDRLNENMTTWCPTHPTKLVDRVHIHLILLDFLAIPRNLLNLCVVDILWPATFRVVYTMRVGLKPFSIHLETCINTSNFPCTMNMASIQSLDNTAVVHCNLENK